MSARISFVLLLCGLLCATAATAGGKEVLDFGLVLEMPDILMDVESYQGGIGAKFGLQKLALRAQLDMDLTPSAGAYSFAVGLGLEKHFLSGGPFSPYWGGLVQVGVSSVKSTIDSQNWDQDIVVPLRLSAILGVEMFILQYLSLFVEYEAALAPTLNVHKSSVGGTVSTGRQLDFNVETGLGNRSMIGVVLYLWRKTRVRPLLKGA